MTGSSRSRQQRGEAVAPLPIYRARPDDPDRENTLAAAVFRIGADAVGWKVYDQAGEAPHYRMRNEGISVHAFNG